MEEKRLLRRALGKFILKEASKEELRRAVAEGGVAPQAFNAFVFSLLRRAVQEEDERAVGMVRHEEQAARRVLPLRTLLTLSFFSDVAQGLKGGGYVAKMQQNQSIFKRTPEELSAAVSGRPHLIALFSAPYNVLCGKIRGLISIKDILKRLKKSSFEYRLSEDVEMDVAARAHEYLVKYVKSMVSDALRQSPGQIGRRQLARHTYGCVHGQYLLPGEYP